MKVDLNIAIVGGCALTQRSIPKENRFFSIAKRKLETEQNSKVSFLFSSYESFYQLEETVLKQLAKKKPDLLIIHLRPQPLLRISKLFLRANNLNIKLNPILTSKKNYPQNENMQLPIVSNFTTKPLFMGLNILLGRLFLVHKIVATQILESLKNIESVCIKHNIQFMILGISPQPKSLQGNYCCKSLNDFLKSKCNDLTISYIDTFNTLNDLEYFQNDCIHLSDLGHNKLGETFYEGFKTFSNKI